MPAAPRRGSRVADQELAAERDGAARGRARRAAPPRSPRAGESWGASRRRRAAVGAPSRAEEDIADADRASDVSGSWSRSERHAPAGVRARTRRTPWRCARSRRRAPSCPRLPPRRNARRSSARGEPPPAPPSALALAAVGACPPRLDHRRRAGAFHPHDGEVTTPPQRESARPGYVRGHGHASDSPRRSTGLDADRSPARSPPSLRRRQRHVRVRPTRRASTTESSPRARPSNRSRESTAPARPASASSRRNSVSVTSRSAPR